MAGYFDDLIPAAPSDAAAPAQPPAAAGGMFDDLIPADRAPTRITVRPNMAQSATAPAARYPGYLENYGAMRRESGSMADEGIAQIMHPDGALDVAKGVGKAALGGLGFVASPINAALRTAVGNPIEGTTGIPREYTEFAAGLALPGVGLTRAPNMARAAKAATPTIDELKAAASAGYESPAATGLEITPSSLATFSQGTRADLDAAGIDAILAPKTHAILEKAGTAPAGPNAVVTGRNLETLRRSLGNAASSIDPTEKKAASDALDALDKYRTNVPASDVLAGDPAAARDAIVTANGNYSAAKHAEMIDKKEVRAQLRAAAANSGQNVPNAMRQRLADVLLSNKERRGFSQGELAQMQRIVEGTATRNALRFTGNIMGGGGGLGMLASGAAGTIASGSTAALPVLPAIGFGLKKLEGALTMRDVAKLHEAIRARSPLAQRVGAPLQQWSQSAQAAQASPIPRNIALLSVASRNLSNNLRDAGVNISPDDLLRTLTTTPQGGASENQ